MALKGTFKWGPEEKFGFIENVPWILDVGRKVTLKCMGLYRAFLWLILWRKHIPVHVAGDQVVYFFVHWCWSCWYWHHMICDSFGNGLECFGQPLISLAQLWRRCKMLCPLPSKEVLCLKAFLDWVSLFMYVSMYCVVLLCFGSVLSWSLLTSWWSDVGEVCFVYTVDGFWNVVGHGGFTESESKPCATKPNVQEFFGRAAWSKKTVTGRMGTRRGVGALKPGLRRGECSEHFDSRLLYA